MWPWGNELAKPDWLGNSSDVGKKVETVNLNLKTAKLFQAF